MWEFMCRYAESFWIAGEYAFDVFSVIMAWILTLAIARVIYMIITVISEIIIEEVKEKNE